MIEAIAQHLATLYPEASSAGGRLTFSVGKARVHVLVRLPDADGAFARTPIASLAYRVEGSLDGAEDLVRALLRQLARELLAWQPHDADSTPRSIDAGAVDAIAATYRASVSRGERLEEPGPAPCLSLTMRPRPPPLVGPLHGALVEPCVRCGVAAGCEVAATPTEVTRPLRPLRHGEPLGAALSASSAIARAWNRPRSAALDALLVELTAARVGALSSPPPPFEFSLKIEDDQLAPAIRVVEYSASGPQRLERSRARRNLVTAIAERLAPETDWERWLARIESEQPAGLELSLGLEARLDSEEIAPQIYAHIDPAGREAMRRLVAELAPDAELESLLELALDRPVELVLVALAPRGGDPHAIKLYLATPLALQHAPSGLEPAKLAELAPHAPEWGLTVLERSHGAARFRKHDFPCATHFQRATTLADDFGHGLDDGDRARLEDLLGGEAFAAWPTWMSVSPRGKTLYFIPR